MVGCSSIVSLLHLFPKVTVSFTATTSALLHGKFGSFLSGTLGERRYQMEIIELPLSPPIIPVWSTVGGHHFSGQWGAGSRRPRESEPFLQGTGGPLHLGEEGDLQQGTGAGHPGRGDEGRQGGDSSLQSLVQGRPGGNPPREGNFKEEGVQWKGEGRLKTFEQLRSLVNWLNC